MNETIQSLIERRSIRKYKSEQISNNDLELILLAGSYAANAGSRQSPVMVVLQNREIIEKLGRINSGIFAQYKRLVKKGNVSTEQPSIADDDTIVNAFYGAPTVVAVFVPKAHGYGVEDGSLVLGNMMIAAHSLGIGSCMVARAHETFDTVEGKEIMQDWGIGDEYKAVGFCILGTRDGSAPKAKPRKEYVVKKIQ